jgi:trehalose 6-phosphate phosphatase
VFVDFDGTLAPIVDDPAAARVHDGAAAALRDLARRWGLVAVVSGRPAAFLAEHLAGLGRTHLYGLYGLEWVEPESGRIRTRPGTDQWRAPVDAAAHEATEAIGPTLVERKGLTVTLHFRGNPAQEEAVDRLAARLADRHGLKAHVGKMSRELRPPVAVDKGTVLRDLAAGLTAVAFAGDDVGDLPAFDALHQLRASGVTTLSVAAGGRETPESVLRRADLVVPGPAGIVRTLQELAAD